MVSNSLGSGHEGMSPNNSLCRKGECHRTTVTGKNIIT